MSAKGNFMPFRKINTSLLAAAMTIALLPAGCKVVNQSPAPANDSSSPAPANNTNNETVVYQKWEAETHRPHVELTQRTRDEQKEYTDWRQKHPDHR
jgi:hypothetical protein